MKFKDLTKEQIEYAKKIYKSPKSEYSWDEKMKILMELFDKSERTVRKWCSNKLGFVDKPENISEQFKVAKQKQHDKSKKYYLISWAQANTPINKEMLINMKAYAKFLNAEILVIAGRYSNRMETLLKNTKESWVDDISPYLAASRLELHSNLDVIGDLKINATASNILVGLNGISKEKSCIIGAPKQQMHTVPILKNKMPKIMMSTGAITKKNYTDSRVGYISSFHHCYGFVICELCENSHKYHIRQVPVCNDGSFQDLWFSVKDGEVNRIDKISGCVMGDYHAGEHDEKVISKTLELFKKLKPEVVAISDIFEGKSISHHDREDPFIQYEKEINGDNSLKKEIDIMLGELKRFEDYNVVIIKSNHDTFVDRWLKAIDWRKPTTYKNSLEYMQFCTAILSGEAKNGIIPWVINKSFPKIKTLGYNDSFTVNDFELSQHGDFAANGARGSIGNFRALNTKLVIQHSHSPKRFDNVLQVGCSCKLDMDYLKGPSSWMHSHVLLMPNKKATHIFFNDGEFTTLE
jgi:hypothetical protein